MKGDDRHFQLRLGNEARAEVSRIANRAGLKSVDVIRGALYFGLPIFEVMIELRGTVVERLVKALRRNARKGQKQA